MTDEERAFLALGRAYQAAVRAHLAAQKQVGKAPLAPTWRRYEEAARDLLEAAMGLPERSDE